MARLIDADALIESIKHGLWDWETVNGIESRTVLEQTIQDIRNEPTIDAEPVRHGEWIKENIVLTSLPPQRRWHCSVCGSIKDGYDESILTPYCSNCGAEMDEQE